MEGEEGKKAGLGLVLLNSLEGYSSELLCGSRRFYRFQEWSADAVTREGNKVMLPVVGQNECQEPRIGKHNIL